MPKYFRERIRRREAQWERTFYNIPGRGRDVGFSIENLLNTHSPGFHP